MTPQTIFYIIIGILIINFTVDKVLDYLNAKHFNDPIPEELNDVYDTVEYQKSQLYKDENYRFGIITSSLSLIATLAFYSFASFCLVDDRSRNLSENNIVVA